MIALRPTEPAPKTAMLRRKRGSTEFKTAPAPVGSPQPNAASISMGMSFLTLTTLRIAATEYVAKDDWPKKWLWTISSPLRRLLEPSRRAAAKLHARSFSQ